MKLLLIGLIALLHASAYGAFHEVARFPLGGDERWDYVTLDSQARRIYLARSNRIQVVDPDSGKLIGEVTGLDGAHGVALDTENSHGFATSGKSSEVIVFDLKTFKVLSKIKTGEGPDAIVFNPASKRVVAFNGKGRSATVIDSKTLQSIGNVPLAGKPEFAANGDGAKVFVNLETRSELVELDTSLLKILSTYPLSPCESPTGLSIDSEAQRLIVGCDNQLAVIVDVHSGKVSQTFKVGDGVDATAYDSEHHLAYISAGEGLLTILSKDAKGFQLLQNLGTVKGARTLAVDSKTGRVFLPFAQFQGKGPRPAIVRGSVALLVIGN